MKTKKENIFKRIINAIKAKIQAIKNKINAIKKARKDVIDAKKSAYNEIQEIIKAEREAIKNIKNQINFHKKNIQWLKETSRKYKTPTLYAVGTLDAIKEKYDTALAKIDRKYNIDAIVIDGMTAVGGNQV